MVDSAIPRIKNLAWPGFTTLELQQVEDWIAGGNGRSDATHTVCLSLLPRLLALTDMSLSIILFSSSNQRALVELFEPYSNVITGFQKPHFFSRNSGDGLQSTYEQLATMLQRALSWNDLRSKCREIRSLRSASFSQDSALTAQGPSSRELYVELFIDEDDKSNVARFAVGGVFAIFNSVKDADCFDDIAVENGLRYFRGDLFPPQVFAQNRYPLLKKDYGCNGRRELARSLDRFRKGGGTVDLGFLQVRRGNVKGHAELARDEHDSRFLWMLSSVIELFAAESLPAISEQRGITLNDVSVSVYVGTRVVNTTESGDYTFQSNVKVHHFEDGPKLRSLGEDSIHTMVTECLRRHGITHMRFVRTIGRTLPYEGALPDKIKCVIDRVHNKVMAFDPGNDCAISVALGKKCIGRVSSKIEDRGFGFVEVPGLGAHVFIHYKQCTSYVDLLTGIPVSLRVERQRKPDGTQGYNGYEVCACTEADYEEWKGANRDHLSEDFLERVTNKDPASLRPDYRALHYVADQVMRYGVEEYSLGDADKLRGQFDEDCDLSMTLALESSRCLDLSDLSGAVRSFSFARPALRSYERPLARTLIGSRIASALDSCTGDQIVLALQEASSIEPHDHANLLVIAVQHQQPKAYASPARSSPTGAVESKPEVLTHDLASTVLTFRVKRAVSLDFLQNKLQSCFGARLRGVRAKEIGDDPDYRDVSFYLPPEFSHQIDAVSKSLQAKGWKVQVSKPPTDSEASATCSG
jgi:cold shock CspA family protein